LLLVWTPARLALAPHRFRALIVALTVTGLVIAAVPTATQGRPGARTAAHQLSGAVLGKRTFQLKRAATHVAVYWRGADGARVRVAFRRSGHGFGRWRPVVQDEIGEQRRDGRTYGSVMLARGASAVRVATDRPLRRLFVLGLTDAGGPRRRSAATTATHVPQPAVVARAGWGADESLRFDSRGSEVWPPAFYPVQKLIVHHTATINNDPDPAATIRSIYYYHAVTQGWGDIGYNFLVDEAGTVYEGRYSRQYGTGEYPTGEDLAGDGVTAAHASGFNSGTVGIALLGTLTDRDATPSARGALERLLAWKADRHAIDPRGSSLYTNPVNGTQLTFANIAAHRDVNATECPGGRLYAALPSIRDTVAALIAGSPSDSVPPAAPSGLVAAAGDARVTLDWADNAEGDLAGYDVYRATGGGGPYTKLTTTRLTASAYTDTSVTNGTAYYYVVTASDTAGNESAASGEASATPVMALISLTARGYKVKGYQRVDVTWSGARSASVDLYRDGARIAVTANDGFHTDAINRKGAGTYRYRVCEAGTSTCSAEATVGF
jgi:hypothetical protein